ncbi:MAG: TetR/AcrR family transcriptional regulator [Cyanobacteria bacterium P01_A01_bin.17]
MSKTGRPREFSVDAALDKAVEVFYVKGYEAATLDDLTAAMGIQRPSLYSAFGNKEALFLRAIERYRESYVRSAQATLSEEPNGKKAIERFLAQVVECHVKSNGLGCLIVNSSVDCQALQASICDRIRQIHTQNEEMIYQRLQRAVADGDLSHKTDIRGLAQFYNGVIQGMAVLARGQNNPDAVRSMAVFAIKAWPGAPIDEPFG